MRKTRRKKPSLDPILGRLDDIALALLVAVWAVRWVHYWFKKRLSEPMRINFHKFAFTYSLCMPVSLLLVGPWVNDLAGIAGLWASALVLTAGVYLWLPGQ